MSLLSSKCVLGTAFVLGVLLAVTGSSAAGAAGEGPPVATVPVLTDYDCRTDVRTPSQHRTGLRPTERVEPAAARAGARWPTARQTLALERLEESLGVPVEVAWSSLSPAPRFIRARRGYLADCGDLSPQQHARRFLEERGDLFGLGEGFLETLGLPRVARDRQSGATIVVFAQRLGGTAVLDGTVRLTYDGQGRLVQVNASSLIPGRTKVAERIVTAEDALMAAAPHAGVILDAPLSQLSPASAFPVIFERGPFRREAEVAPALFPQGAAAGPCWVVLLTAGDGSATYSIAIDAVNGSLLRRVNLARTVQTEGAVFPHDPVTDGFNGAVMPFADDTFNVSPYSPLGWAFDDETLGNNAEVRDDRAGDDDATTGAVATGITDPGPPPRIRFDFPFTNAYESTGAAGDLDAALVNVFYHVNVFHDFAYEHGFDEPSGNFQTDNFGLGGAGSDPVLVDVQDSAGLPSDTTTRNRSTITTLPDGQPARMELTLYEPPYALRDPAFDGDIIAHELAHAMAERLVGGPGRVFASTCLLDLYGCALAEGWSDFLADHLMDDPVFGQYTSGHALNGFRSAAADANTYTLGDFCQIPFIVPPGVCLCNNNGEIFTSVLWDLRTLLLAADPAQGKEVTAELVVDSMKLAPCEPTFLDVRDAMLSADVLNYGGVHHCTIWQAFADRGMGVNASIAGVDDDSPVEDFTLPPECGTGADIFLDRPRYPSAGTATVTVADGNLGADPPVTLTSTMAGDTLVVTLAQAAFPGTFTGTVTLSDDTADPGNQTLEVVCGDTITATYGDTNPPQNAVVTAAVDCVARVSSRYRITGGDCDADEVPGFDELRGFLDPGETAMLEVFLSSNEPWPIDGASLAVACADPRVHILDTAPAALDTLPRALGAAEGRPVTASFAVQASPLAPAGLSVDVDLIFSAPGYTGLDSPVATLLIGKDYQLNRDVASAAEDFEAGGLPAGWSTEVESPPDQWAVVNCLGGTSSLHDGAADCTSPYSEASATTMYSAPYNFTSPSVEAYRPTALVADHVVDLGASGGLADTLTIYLTDPVMPGGTAVPLVTLDAADNTGASFQPFTQTITAGQAAAFDLAQGFGIGWSLTRDGDPASTGTGYFVDNVGIVYDQVALIDHTAPCEPYLQGTLSGCDAGSTLSLYNPAVPSEMQICCDGGFYFEAPSDWAIMNSELPTPPAAGDDMVLLVSRNPGGGAHPGAMGANRQTLPSPVPHAFDFGATACAAIPQPVPSTVLVAEGGPLTLTWSPLAESGTSQAVIGYQVYRIDASRFPAATSTITDYITPGRGELIGDTVGQPDIHTFQETAPMVAADTPFTYVIRPVLAGGTGIPATFGGREGVPGTPNISTDSEEVLVQNVLYVEFDYYRAEAVPEGNRVTWGTRTEVHTEGFYVLRGATNDPDRLEPVNRLPIEPAGSGSTYSFLDPSPGCGSGCYYQILELTSAGEPSRTPVFAVDAASGPVGRSQRAR